MVGRVLFHGMRLGEEQGGLPPALLSNHREAVPPCTVPQVLITDVSQGEKIGGQLWLLCGWGMAQERGPCLGRSSPSLNLLLVTQEEWPGVDQLQHPASVRHSHCLIPGDAEHLLSCQT